VIAPALYRGRPVVRMHAMAKPIGAACNFACEYCYYLSKAELLGPAPPGRMSDEILERFIRQYLEGQNCKEAIFSWQGGEPTLAGLDFFRRVVALERKYCPPHTRCENDLQTNGALLNDDWCAFLRENNFLVGLSIDGPRALHDAYRRDKAGHGTFSRVFRAAQLLRRHGVPFNTLSCVNRVTARHPVEVYRFLRDEVGAQRMQFIPIVEPKGFARTAPQHWPAAALPAVGSPAARPGTPDSVVEDWCVDPDDWGGFLCGVFDEWLRHDLGRIHVQYFEAAVETWMGRVNPLCTLGPLCGKGVAVEHDGSVYACDHYVYPEYRRGSLRETPLAELVLSPQQECFGTDKERTLPDVCRQCAYEFACFGECPKNRFVRAPDGQPGLNYLCPGWRRFWQHVDEPIQRILYALGHAPAKQRLQAAPAVRA